MIAEAAIAGSPSIEQPDYWWFQIRAVLLERAMAGFVSPDSTVLDVGSADGPSVGWLRQRSGHRVPMDLDPRGVEAGGVVASALAMPFTDGAFDVVSAFDVIEHIDPEATALEEIARVLKPGGYFLMAVPAYQWAWTSFDDLNHHRRRYTRKRANRALRAAGFEVLRSTHAFAGVFPFFAADRLRTRVAERGMDRAVLRGDDVPPLRPLSPRLTRLMWACSSLDTWSIGRHDLPFGSSIFVVARKPGGH